MTDSRYPRTASTQVIVFDADGISTIACFDDAKLALCFVSGYTRSIYGVFISYDNGIVKIQIGQ